MNGHPGKAILAASIFFVAWVVAIGVTSLLPDPVFTEGSPALRRLWWEALPCLSTVLLTFAFRHFSATRHTRRMAGNPLRNAAIGIGFGISWIGISLAIPYFQNTLQVTGSAVPSYLPLWFLACLLNVIMQEYLVRGYIFDILEADISTPIAVIASTVLFTVLHGNAFTTGIVAVLDVMTMSLFASSLLLYTGSLLAPIIVHFIWNAVGGIVFGCVALADEYPHLLNCTGTGASTIETGIPVLIVNCLLTAIVMMLLKRRQGDNGR